MFARLNVYEVKAFKMKADTMFYFCLAGIVRGGGEQIFKNYSLKIII